MYTDFDQLYLNPPLADAYICGSDQIWNIVNHTRKEFFLQFGSPETKRISYAASFGVSNFPEEKLAELKELLKDFDSISVRENAGVSLLQNKLQIAASQCIDPVFLIKDEWEKLLLRAAPIVPDEPYILVYSLFNNKLMDELIKQAKKQYNCKIVQVAYKGFSPIYHDKMIVNAGPLEFLSLIKNAKAVITSSFHGTAFSVIFKKPFLTVVNPLVGSRITDLLASLGLGNRVANNKDQYRMLDCMDYSESDKRTEEIIERSKTFLKNALGVKDE